MPTLTITSAAIRALDEWCNRHEKRLIQYTSRIVGTDGLGGMLYEIDVDSEVFTAVIDQAVDSQTSISEIIIQMAKK